MVNFGQVQFSPGAFNIVPAVAEMKLECRAANENKLDELQASMVMMSRQIAEHHDLGFDYQDQGCVEAEPCATEVQAAFAQACALLELGHIFLVSGAGHDTQAMARVCPAGMIFIPSSGGSHSPREFAEWDACVTGANVMLQAALRLALQR